MSRATEIQQLYIGLLGRAADPVGLDYWTNNGLTIDEIAANIVNEQDEFSFNEEERQAAVEALYLNLFGRPGTEADVNYWTNESLTPIDQLLFTMIQGAGTNDATALNNRTFVANAYTQAAGTSDTFNKEDAAAIIADVDHTTASVTDALNEIDDATFNVVAGIENLAAAQETLDDFLEEQGLGSETAAKDALDTATTDFNNAHDTALTATSNAAQRDTAFNAARADAQHALSNAQAAVDNLDADAEVAAYLAAQAAVADAGDAVEATLVTEAGEIAAYNQAAINADPLATPISLTTLDTSVPGTIAAPLAGGWELIAKINTDGAFSILEVLPAAANNPGIADMIAAVNARIAAQVSEAAAADGLADAKAALDVAADVTGADATVNALIDAQKAIPALEASIAEVQAAYDLNDEVNALVGARDQAEAILVGNDYVVAGLATATATVDNDVYIYTDATTTTDLTDFGADGKDSIFFGAEYSLVAIGEDQAITDNLGSATALEIFWEQVGTGGADLKLYVETVATAGNGSGPQDIVEVTLSGVSMADLDFANGLLAA